MLGAQICTILYNMHECKFTSKIKNFVTNNYLLKIIEYGRVCVIVSWVSWIWIFWVDVEDEDVINDEAGIIDVEVL